MSLCEPQPDCVCTDLCYITETLHNCSQPVHTVTTHELDPRAPSSNGESILCVCVVKGSLVPAGRLEQHLRYVSFSRHACIHAVGLEMERHCHAVHVERAWRNMHARARHPEPYSRTDKIDGPVDVRILFSSPRFPNRPNLLKGPSPSQIYLEATFVFIPLHVIRSDQVDYSPELLRWWRAGTWEAEC